MWSDGNLRESGSFACSGTLVGACILEVPPGTWRVESIHWIQDEAVWGGALYSILLDANIVNASLS